jgi:hypothetical protein
MFTETSGIIAKEKQHKCPSNDKWKKKMMNSNVMNYYLAMKK